ncbi:MAG: MFS transporter [Bacteroidetes bacterium]|nr:MFS transporter [Bacteroidota bacterium]
MRKHLRVYTELPRDIYRLSAGEFLLNLLNSAYLLIFNIWLRKEGYDDSFAGSMTALRYLGVLLASLPIGLYIRGRTLKPLFLVSAVGLPVVSAGLLLAVPLHYPWLTYALMFTWGLFFVLAQVCIQPYVIRHVPATHYGEAFALHYAVVPLSQVVAGILIGWLAGSGVGWTEQEVLLLISLLGLLAVAFFWGLADHRPAALPSRFSLRGGTSLRADYQWGRIGRALVPTLILAVGAGFTFPFINLFFYTVFGVDSQAFGLMGAASSVLVMGAVVLGPALKRQFGYGVAVTLTQTLAVVLLLGLVWAELQHTAGWALPLAVGIFLLRAPLMKAAQPLAGELTVRYVGPANREMISAFTSSIWSGSWVISSQLFAWLRAMAIPYWQIFLVTAALYGAGVVAYVFLIRAVNRMPVEAETVEIS